MDTESSPGKDPFRGFRISQPDSQDPVGSIQQFMAELQGFTEVARGIADLALRVDADALPEVEKLLPFMTSECHEEFIQQFIQHGWSATETPEMVATWRVAPIMNNQGALGPTL